jgi:hypothetical protein
LLCSFSKVDVLVYLYSTVTVYSILRGGGYINYRGIRGGGYASGEEDTHPGRRIRIRGGGYASGEEDTLTIEASVQSLYTAF